MAKNFLDVIFIKDRINYDGSQLDTHWILKKTEIMGDCAVAFCGACDIPYKNMVDLEDELAGESIASNNMLHFIIELFGIDTLTAVAIQGVFVAEIQNELLKNNINIDKQGDDLFLDDKKLSISIATVSSTSALIHIGLNIGNEGTPVKTCALNDFNINPENFAKYVLERFNKEFNRIKLATTKVKGR
jgi:hypothetical protein